MPSGGGRSVGSESETKERNIVLETAIIATSFLFRPSSQQLLSSTLSPFQQLPLRAVAIIGWLRLSLALCEQLLLARLFNSLLPQLLSTGTASSSDTS